MAFLVTGAAGFIGAYVVRRLLDEGEKVIAFDVAAPGKTACAVLGSAGAAAPFVQGEIADLAGLLDIVERHDVDTVVHLAAIAEPPVCRANPRAAVRVNVEGHATILEVARIRGLRRVVWASSVDVFGRRDLYPGALIANDAVHDPQTLYGATKVFCEHLAQTYAEAHGVDSIGLRFTLVYGIGKQRGMSRELLYNSALGLPARVPYGDETPDWLYVEDAARAVVLAARSTPTETKVFNIVGDLRPIRDAVACVRSLLPDAEIAVEPGYYAHGFNLDGSRAEAELGYRAQWPLERGVRSIINQVRAEHGLLPVPEAVTVPMGHPR